MSFTSDNRYMLTDTYPDHEKFMQTLQIYDTQKDVVADIGKFYSSPYSVIDVRCDLHPRWNRSENGITFDSTHEGFRGVYKMDLDDKTMAKLFE